MNSNVRQIPLSCQLAYHVKQIGPDVNAHHPLHERYALGNQQGKETEFASCVQKGLSCAKLTDTLVLCRERANGGILGRGWSRDSREVDEKALQGIRAKVAPRASHVFRVIAANDPGEDLSKALCPVSNT